MFIFIDTETTGPGPEDRLCQIAYKTDENPMVDELFNPGLQISIESMSIHHITNKMVADKPAFKNSPTFRELQGLFSRDDSILVGHNARFDVSMLNREGLYPQKVICTNKLARYLDEDGVIPDYSLQYLRYYMKLNIDATPHTASGDVLVLEKVFQKLYNKIIKHYKGMDPISLMIKISGSPVKIAFMPLSNLRM
jgi:DNA polymerase III epsilon subunit-like protein